MNRLNVAGLGLSLVLLVLSPRGQSKAFSPLHLLCGNLQVEVLSADVQFQVVDQNSRVIAGAHPKGGLTINGQAVTETVLDGAGNALVVRTGQGLRAKVSVLEEQGAVAVTVAPEAPGQHQITLSVAGMPVAYGLGDTGGWNNSLNLVGEKQKEYKIHHDGGRHRWVSSFVVFPANGFAGVVFDGTDKKVSVGKDRYTMSVKADGPVTFYYLPGDMPTIYKNYRALLTAKGFPEVKPKFRLFELGWESWAALGWQTNAKTMLDSITRFQELGYPIRWAVSGSGYWEEGGTTTSFGKFGEKFSPAEAFKQALHDRDVKWMIGLRTNFVPPGGPYWPVTKERDQNMVVDSFNGNPVSQEALDKGYFLKNQDGTLWKKHSGCFPIVLCYLLDGANPDAVAWYADLYHQWGVDGIKEDTMMGLGATHTGVFDQPIARIAEEGGLVMARCGSFSAPGTLLRINDTSVNEMSRRTPINYLQYAASGAPNVYSDTVGFRKMKSYSEMVVRHAWLMALTAGLAIGESSEAWSEKQQAIFKRPFDLHYQLGPYLFDAAMKSYRTGYPFTMTPLGIAYPEDVEAMEPSHFQWMAGESLLCAPLLKNHASGRMDIYLPKGTWFDYDTGEQHQGPKLLKDVAVPVDKTPCFVGGKGVLVLRDSDDAALRAVVYPLDRGDEAFVFHYPDGESVSAIKFSGRGPLVGVSGAGGEQLQVQAHEASGAISFEVEPGVHYNVIYR